MSSPILIKLHKIEQFDRFFNFFDPDAVELQFPHQSFLCQTAGNESITGQGKNCMGKYYYYDGGGSLGEK